MRSLFFTSVSFIIFAAFAAAADVPRTLYVLNSSAETVSKMNLETGAIQQNIVKTGQVPNQIMVDHGMIYVLNSGSSSLQIIDPLRDVVVKTILLQPGANPWMMAVTGRTKAYVSNWVANTVSIIDLELGKLLVDIPVGRGPEGILVVGNLAFVANTGYTGWGAPFEQGSVMILDTRTDQIVFTLATPTNPQDLALAPDGRIHVLCTGDYADIGGKIAVIDLNTGPNWDVPAVVDTIELGGSPGDLEITPAGKAYAAAWGDGVNGFLYVYDAFSGAILHGADAPLLVGPNLAQTLYDGRENCLWIPYMTQWGGDGFVQKWDVQSDTLLATSDVIGNGSQKAAILERIWEITPWADRVASFIPGAGAGFGKNYFPENVLGPPDQSPGLNEYNPSNKPQELLSLGNGGEIVLEFVDNLIVDGPGVDFTVFENVFISLFDGQPFIEAGIVAVSQNGLDFFEFPYNLETWQGLAGVTPTRDVYNFIDPTRSGGDSFDLADVGLNWVKYVKITDLGDLKKEGSWNGDFDLDAVVAVHSAPCTFVAQEIEDIHSFRLAPNFPNPFNSSTTIPIRLSAPAVVRLEIINLQGQIVRTLVNRSLRAGEYLFAWDGQSDDGFDAPSSVYFALLTDGSSTSVAKMTLLR